MFQPNDFYPTGDEYLEALAEALRTEYEAIVAAGVPEPDIVYMKLGALVEGARIASARLWGPRGGGAR